MNFRHELRVRDVKRLNGKPNTKNIRIEIIVRGVTDDKVWECGLEFDCANSESLYCRPLRLSHNSERMPIPEEAARTRISFLPPMSGLAANEIRLEDGTISVRIGEGRTAEVLRNLCYRIYEENPDGWKELNRRLDSLFGAVLNAPRYIRERGEIAMSYLERGTELDIACSGRGLQQTLLLLAYMLANPGSVIMLDEPDAHLEILRQRQMYQLLTDMARENGNQIIAASHSEVLLNEAASRDVVVAFVGKPHRIDDRGTQALKSLRDIGFEDYYLAEQTGWVLYLEGSTDLAILRAFAQTLGFEEAARVLDKPFVHYIGENRVARAQEHFHGLREAVPGLKGVALLDLMPDGPRPDPHLKALMWRKREIENYLCFPETLANYARETATMVDAPLFHGPEAERRVKAMEESVAEVQIAMQTLDKGSPWAANTKVSDDFLAPLFKTYFKKLALPNLMEKKNFHELARHVPASMLDSEVREKLEAIVGVATHLKG